MKQQETKPISIDQDRCICCESCVSACTVGIFCVKDGNIALENSEYCMVCGHCMAICPEDAIRVFAADTDEFEPIQQLTDSPDPDRLMGLFRRRRSVRRYEKRPVEREKIEKIIEAARFAPTGGNYQPFKYSVVQTPEMLHAIKKMILGSFVEATAEVYGILTEKIKQGETLSAEESYYLARAERHRQKVDLLDQGIDRLLFDAPALIALYVPPELAEFTTEPGFVGMQMLLMAESLGLGTCIIGYIAGSDVAIANSLPEVKKAMNIPEDHVISIAFVVGYSDFDYLRSVSRKPAAINWG